MTTTEAIQVTGQIVVGATVAVTIVIAVDVATVAVTEAAQQERLRYLTEAQRILLLRGTYLNFNFTFFALVRVM
jgi:hypothetical protein